MKKLFLMFFLLLPFTFSLQAETVEADTDFSCNWNFSYNFNCGNHYNAGHTLYVKANPDRRYDIEWMELYVNNKFIRKEMNYPYEWAKGSSGDSYLRNMQPGTYHVKIKVKDKCGKYNEKKCTIYIDQHNGGGGHHSACKWDFYWKGDVSCEKHYPYGEDLYVKVDPHKYQDIEWMELYVNNNYIRKESSYPYEWGKPGTSGDNYLRKMKAGTYKLRIKVKDKCGKYHEKECTVYIDHQNGGGGHHSACKWDFYWKGDVSCEKHYPYGEDLYVKVDPHKYQDIEWMELYVNNNYIRKESSYPYEWGKPGTSGDNYLRKMKAGTYKLRIKVKDKCGKYHEKECTVYIDHQSGGGGHHSACKWDFYWKGDVSCGKHYPYGENLYVKVDPHKSQDIEWMELYVNNNYIRKESSYPYEWGKSGSNADGYLKNMKAGTYKLRVKVKDKCGKYHEKECTVYVDQHNGGGGHHQQCNWNTYFSHPSNTHYPKYSDIYVKLHPDRYQDIEWVELYVNNNFVRKESNYPYEWAKGSSGDNYLRKMKPGTYHLKCRYKDKCGDIHEKKKTIYIKH